LIGVAPRHILVAMMLSVRLLRPAAWLALGCQLIVASGLPVPLGARPSGDAAATGRVAKDRSRPFPCMDKACGCATAEQCFASCCCHTPAQRLAWAKANGLEATVLAALERRAGAAARTAAGCCATASPTASCRATAAAEPVDPDAPEVCGDYRSLAAEPRPGPRPGQRPADEPEPVSHEDDPAPGVVILRDALACGGILSAWLACGAALPPPPRTSAPSSRDPAGALALHDEVAPSCSAEPSAPPPRVG